MKKSKLTQNLGLKGIALVFAALLWLLVVNIDDPVDSVSFRNIPVTIINDEVVTNQGKVYQVVDGVGTVNVTVYATRSVLSKITADDIIATADFSQMEVNTYLVPISVSVRRYDAVAAEAVPNNLQVKIEDMTKNTFPISASASGTPRDGYLVGQMTPNPERITVRGSESMVGSISKIVARVDVSGLSADSTLDAQLIYYDGNGNVMDASQFKNNLGEAGVSVNVQMLRIKEVALDVEMPGTPKDGYIYTGWSTEPQTIQVCGTDEALTGLTSIKIPSEAVNIDGKGENTTFTVDILPYLPENVRLVDESASNVVVTVAIEEQGTKTIEIPVEAIRVDHLSEDLRISFEEETEISLQFSGIEERLERLEVSDIRNAVFINLNEYTSPGTYEVTVDVEEMEGITLTKKPKLTIVLAEKKDGEKAGTEEEE